MSNTPDTPRPPVDAALPPLPAAPAGASSARAAVAAPSAVAPHVTSEDTRRLCVELARQAHDFHPGRDWLGVMPILQRIWLREPREIGWDDAGALIHAAWMMRPR